jgi:hypothetical protein
MLPSPEELETLRHQLQVLRIYLYDLKSPELTDLEALLSVAQAELERAAPAKRRQRRR